ncbi:BCL-6 corepressor-like protein 1 isoform X2 [Neocloeon triangulifer]|uniref:BCL-6 corepressor-like protein 1 isoform X2 n=1 Tax=Neocloeon triangulifer TaxID=2078957 RepID=UPI00286F0CB9|nr:BCL-6 corepressor-like protein 1 isoform X2 [Neocloeon triangulifer]
MKLILLLLFAVAIDAIEFRQGLQFSTCESVNDTNVEWIGLDHFTQEVVLNERKLQAHFGWTDYNLSNLPRGVAIPNFIGKKIENGFPPSEGFDIGNWSSDTLYFKYSGKEAVLSIDENNIPLPNGVWTEVILSRRSRGRVLVQIGSSISVVKSSHDQNRIKVSGFVRLVDGLSSVWRKDLANLTLNFDEGSQEACVTLWASDNVAGIFMLSGNSQQYIQFNTLTDYVLVRSNVNIALSVLESENLTEDDYVVALLSPMTCPESAIAIRDVTVDGCNQGSYKTWTGSSKACHACSICGLESCRCTTDFHKCGELAPGDSTTTHSPSTRPSTTTRLSKTTRPSTRPSTTTRATTLSTTTDIPIITWPTLAPVPPAPTPPAPTTSSAPAANQPMSWPSPPRIHRQEPVGHYANAGGPLFQTVGRGAIKKIPRHPAASTWFPPPVPPPSLPPPLLPALAPPSLPPPLLPALPPMPHPSQSFPSPRASPMIPLPPRPPSMHAPILTSQPPHANMQAPLAMPPVMQHASLAPQASHASPAPQPPHASPAPHAALPTNPFRSHIPRLIQKKKVVKKTVPTRTSIRIARRK